MQTDIQRLYRSLLSGRGFRVLASSDGWWEALQPTQRLQ